jgi:hypothetical protein
LAWILIFLFHFSKSIVTITWQTIKLQSLVTKATLYMRDPQDIFYVCKHSDFTTGTQSVFWKYSKFILADDFGGLPLSICINKYLVRKPVSKLSRLMDYTETYHILCHLSCLANFVYFNLYTCQRITIGSLNLQKIPVYIKLFHHKQINVWSAGCLLIKDIYMVIYSFFLPGNLE